MSSAKSWSSPVNRTRRVLIVPLTWATWIVVGYGLAGPWVTPGEPGRTTGVVLSCSGADMAVLMRPTRCATFSVNQRFASGPGADAPEVRFRLGAEALGELGHRSGGGDPPDLS